MLATGSYDFIINASAYTNVSEAEIEPQNAYKVNDTAIKNIASLIDKNSSLFVHFSTDYVFEEKKIHHTLKKTQQIRLMNMENLNLMVRLI